MKTKIMFFLLTTLLIQSCVNNTDNKLKTKQQNLIISNSPLIKRDSSTYKDWRLREIGKILTQWSKSNLTLKNKKIINSNVFSILCTHSDGVSITSYLFTFNKNKVKDHEILEYEVDQDLSSPQNYEYKVLKDTTYSKYIIVNYIQSVIDKNVLNKNGEFKNGLDFENVKVKTDSIVTKLTILNDGKIKRDTIK